MHWLTPNRAFPLCRTNPSSGCCAKLVRHLAVEAGGCWPEWWWDGLRFSPEKRLGRRPPCGAFWLAPPFFFYIYFYFFAFSWRVRCEQGRPAGHSLVQCDRGRAPVQCSTCLSVEFFFLSLSLYLSLKPPRRPTGMCARASRDQRRPQTSHKPVRGKEPTSPTHPTNRRISSISHIPKQHPPPIHPTPSNL